MEKLKKIVKVLWRIVKALWWIVMFLWQLPQTFCGSVIALLRHRDGCFWYKGKVVCIDDRFVNNQVGDKTHNGISLGLFIILEKFRIESLDHEYGHCRQSEFSGWLYLLVFGAPSGIHNLIHHYKEIKKLPRRDYYAFWTERSADLLGGVKRIIIWGKIGKSDGETATI